MAKRAQGRASVECGAASCAGSKPEQTLQHTVDEGVKAITAFPMLPGEVCPAAETNKSG
jgi:hypothetical protein